MVELSVPEVASLRGITRMAAHKQVTSGRLPARRILNTRGGAAGEQYLIPLSALTDDEQARYWAQHGGKPSSAAETPPATIRLSRPEQAALVRRYLAGGRSMAEATALAAEAGVHVSTLYRWIAEARARGQDCTRIAEIDALVRFPRSSVPVPDLAAAVGWLLSDPRRTLQDAHARLRETGARISYVQWTRLLKAMHPPLALLRRYRDSGAVPLRLTQTPKILRKWSALPAGHTYIGDQHLLDYQCVLPETGEVINLQLYLWMDASTTYWVGLAGSHGPYTQYTVGLSLLDACRLHVPSALLNDNGRQEKSAYIDRLWGRLSGLFDLSGNPNANAARDDRRHYTTPNLPPVKPIEAQMAVLTRYLNQAELDGYRKRDPDPFRNQQRQAELAKAKQRGTLPTVDELLTTLVQVMERHNTTPARSEVDGATYIPAERFWTELGDRRLVLPDPDLKALFYPRFERKVRNACVRVRIGHQVREFTHPDLIQIGHHESVQVLINPLPPHAGGLVLRQDDAGVWQPFCPLEPWLGRGIAPYADRDTLEELMRQKQTPLNRFRDAIKALHAATRAKFAPEPDKPAAKILRLTDAARLRDALPELEPEAAPREPAKVLDHQGALRALLQSRRNAAS